MAKKEWRCINVTVCRKAQNEEAIDSNELNPVCPECQKPLVEHADRHDAPRYILGIAILVAALAGIGWALYYLFPDTPPPTVTDTITEPKPEPVDPTPVHEPERCKPLLIAGKKTLYQRVLTRPGAFIQEQPEDFGGRPVDAFTRYYIYDRQFRDGVEWLKLGADVKCENAGWVRAGQTVPWKQQLTLAFSNPAGRDPILFFSDRKDLEQIVESKSPATELDPLIKDAQTGGGGPRIVSIEPENLVDIRNEFYLLPIMDFADAYSESEQKVRLLRVSSISKPREPEWETPQRSPLTAAIVFVIDATISMAPYIERTKDTIREIYNRFRDLSTGDLVRFGLVGFRSNIRDIPALEYDAKLFADPNKVPLEEDFLRQVGDLEAATVSSPIFDEDAYAGMMISLNSIDWTGFNGRYVVLITDAGALDANDPLSKTKKGATDIREIAEDKKVIIYAIHLKTSVGEHNHQKAERQYRTLAANSITGDPLYYSVEAGSLDFFGDEIDCLTNSIVHNVNSINQDSVGQSLTEGSLLKYCPENPTDAPVAKQIDKMRDDQLLLGHALQLEYLGQIEGTAAPDVFDGWIADADPKNPTRKTVDVHILLSRNELNDLYEGVNAIQQAALVGRSKPSEFFNKLTSFVSGMARDPNLAIPANATKVSELEILGEYLDDLPYKSAVMNIDQETWETWPRQEHDEFINSISSKLERYRFFQSDDGWIDISEDNGDGEQVYPVPLDALP